MDREGNGGVIASAIIDMNKKGYNEYELAGYLNDYEDVGSLIHGYPVMGKLDQVNEFAERSIVVLSFSSFREERRFFVCSDDKNLVLPL